MKKQLLGISLLVAAMTNAQPFTENFSSATTPGLPTGWLQNNVDGKTPSSQVSAYSFGTNAWVTRDMTSTQGAAYGKLAASTSYYSPAGASNDWLISPTFSVPANGVLEWEAMASDGNYPDGYRVLLSPTAGTLTTDFTATLTTVSAENDTWTVRGANLNAYAGQTVRIAFQNNSNDMFLLFVDNIKMFVPSATDGNVVNITGITRYKAGAGTQAIAGTFRSKGYAAVNDAVLNYAVNGGAVVTQTVTFSTALNYGGTANYSFTTPANLALGTNNIKVWVSHVNGTPETVLTNDTAKTLVYVASQSPQRNALIEEFTSSTCGPCASLNVSFDPLLNGNNPNTGGRLNVIKNQVNWPSPGNDPSYNPNSASRVTYYGINAAPTSLINGNKEMQSHDQTEIDNGKAEPAFATITASLSVSSNSTVITGSATVIPYVSIPANSPLVVHQVLLQSSYKYQGAVTSQKNYYHVMRKMFPSASGATLTPVDGTAMNVSFTHTATVAGTPAQGSYDFWDATNIIYEYVVFVQDKVSDDILQSGSARVDGPVGVIELKDNQQIGIYPNPAKDFAVVGIKLDQTSNVSVAIYDIAGKLVYSNAVVKIEAGQHEMKINTSDFATGTYNVIVNTDLGILKDKLIIVK